MKKRKTNPDIAAGAKKTKKRALGRGLDALIPDFESFEESSKKYFLCNIDLIRPNRYQPRVRFAEEDLQELAHSIKEQGVIQPLLVREDPNGYELVAGERRLRAAKKAGLSEVPVIIQTISETEMLEMSIVENVQREDLTPLEAAEAFHRLITEFNLTQDQAAERVGKSRSAIANFLRLRQLPDPIKESVNDGTISMGHARALLGAETSARQVAVWRTVVSKGLSVRETERLIKKLKTRKTAPESSPTDSEQRYYASLAEELSRHFGTQVEINKRGRKGTVQIRFYSDDDLDRVIGLLKRRG